MSLVIEPEIVSSVMARSGLSKKGLCDYVINVATGCLHGCSFCYVPSTPVIRARSKILQDRGVENPALDWGQYLFYRPDLPKQLENVLRNKRTWDETPAGKGVVMLSSGTDPFQNSKVANITKETVEVLLKYNKRVRLLTRSPLAIKMAAQYGAIFAHPNVTVGFSIPTLNDALSRAIEPRSPRPSNRLDAAKRLKDAGVRIYFAAAPIAPVKNVKGDRLDFETIYDLVQALTALDPEVVFFECINPRGTNGDRMRNLGLNWVDAISAQPDWHAYWLETWGWANSAFWDLGKIGLFHPWPDTQLLKLARGAEFANINYWLERPTVELWPA